ncbi:MAG: hypothetical protein KJ623_00885 [Nanoarchaeota archaeon]|nr:hypothetical protein [Nanoarchaeota archaeon]MBU0962805.1 hypothetical protein [Nanoarchaeota archaeon]
MDSKTIGIIMALGALITFTIFCLYWYIPKIVSDPTNGGVIIIALWWGLGCGDVGTIGALLARR